MENLKGRFSYDIHFSFSLSGKIKARLLRLSCNLLSSMSQLLLSSPSSSRASQFPYKSARLPDSLAL